uniref:Uncharacterized protein n=1 Tax=Bracon brevicornis TaxID=1563983 RepID=A0A6V7K277_9HYME
MPGCTKGCGKKKKRQSKGKHPLGFPFSLVTDLFLSNLDIVASKKSRDKSVETEYISGADEDLSSILSDTTEYLTLPGKSSASEKSQRKKKDRKHKGSDRRPEQTRSGRKTPESRTSPEKIRDDDYSTEKSYLSTSRDKLSEKSRSRLLSSTGDELSDSAKGSLTCATVNLSKFLGDETSESEPSDDERQSDANCDDEECGGGSPRVAIKTKHKEQSSRSESSSEETTSDGSEKCPDLCKIDPTGLPPRKPKKCDSNCRRQEWLEKQREKKQAELDDYLLRKGFRYFDDMCKCSLKCLVSQMYVDPFIRNIALSTVGFFLGVKLCWELDGFYVIF